MSRTEKIGLGGGCHWCTEAVFQSLHGVEEVEQGFVASTDKNDTYSEAVIVHFEAAAITMKDLIEIHLLTHGSTSDHSMRPKYRSAVYTFSDRQRTKAQEILQTLQLNFERPLITQVLPFATFRPSDSQFTNYYYNNPQKPFCRNYIQPKLKLVLERFSNAMDDVKVGLF
ncbi:peptide-methionine (S)-S-oxide reductase [Pricia antarctica]|uniref:peptide-methionine (S)-S-oxide reductase n=1 Tax=Pricia antarctica TaxID=641691 RepID=A0A1G6Y562_9FLAO|nr:peptide-methionine (S)-S-oxide reductase [Pricia antarctica]SDD85624.1 peptide-methionine (S)-S-oxide reductase [Pricia antarctica]